MCIRTKYMRKLPRRYGKIGHFFYLKLTRPRGKLSKHGTGFSNIAFNNLGSGIPGLGRNNSQRRLQ